MTTTELLERARSAVTVEEECAVIWGAILATINEPDARRPLSTVIGSVRARHAPRALLLGVVAALAPEGMTAATIWGDAEKASAKVGPNEVDAASVSWSRAASPALALLIAILEATHE